MTSRESSGRAIHAGGPVELTTSGNFTSMPQPSGPPESQSSYDAGGFAFPGGPGGALETANGWTRQQLFGGAITTELPSSFEDVCNFRQVPDNQEVYVDRNTDMSFIVELLTYEAEVSDAQAANYYFSDLASCNEAAETLVDYQGMITDSRVMPKVRASFPKCCLRGRQSVSKFRARSDTPLDMVQIFLLVLRLPSVGTDVLLTLNAPYAQVSPGQVAERDKEVEGRRGFLSEEAYSRTPMSMSAGAGASAGAETKGTLAGAGAAAAIAGAGSGARSAEDMPALKKVDPMQAEYIVGAALAAFEIVDWALFA